MPEASEVKRTDNATDFRAVRESYLRREPGCAFCDIPADRILSQNSLAYVVRDMFPVTPLHSLIPKRHVPEFFMLTGAEANAIMALIKQTRDDVVSRDRDVSGFNIGVNNGRDAGQTVFHLHVHLIPRRTGDTGNPRGGAADPIFSGNRRLLQDVCGREWYRKRGTLMRYDLIVLNGTVVTSDSRAPADLAIADEKIVAIAAPGALAGVQAERSLDARGLTILPGLIDAHVHLYEPGYPDWEDFPSGTRAAAASGVTTILEMPNSEPPVDSSENLRRRREALQGRALVDFGLYGGLGESNPGAAAAMAEAGAVAFKTFRVQGPLGSPRARLERGVRAPDPGVMLERFRESGVVGSVHAVHAESDSLCRHFTAAMEARGWRRPEHHNLGRPELCEIVSVAETLALAREAGARLHLVHMSSPAAVEYASRARAGGQAVTVETCPQYLVLCAEDMARCGVYGKVHPPLRSAESRDRLWEALNAGKVDTIATDHAPYSLAEKEAHLDDIWKAPAGHPGLDTMLPVLLTQVHRGRLSLQKLVALTSENPARIFGLFPRKGAIRVGSDADLALIDPEAERQIRSEEFFTKSRATARWFEGDTVRGTCVTTVVRGTVVFDRGEITTEPGHGAFVRPDSGGAR
jgi:allantoinase